MIVWEPIFTRCVNVPVYGLAFDSHNNIWASTLNGSGLVYKVSPDGNTLYVGIEWMLSGTEKIVHSSSTMLYGALDNDDMFMYAGGLATAIRNVDGTGLRRLSPTGLNYTPTFSPDGRLVVYASGELVGQDLYAVPVEGGSRRRITVTGSTLRPRPIAFKAANNAVTGKIAMR